MRGIVVDGVATIGVDLHARRFRRITTDNRYAHIGGALRPPWLPKLTDEMD